MSFAKTLSRDEMKTIKGGRVGDCSDFYYRVGGEQTWMESDCFGDTMSGVLNACLRNESATGNTCGGCAQFNYN